MTNKSKLLLTTFFSGILSASSVFGAEIAANTARMQAMDKITGRVSEIDVPVNGLANFGTFSILVRKCVASSPEETPENIAFVDVVDNYRSNEPVNIFKGWMFSSSPALHAVEHPIYDIWLLKCYNRPQERSRLLTDEQLALRDNIPMKRFDPIIVTQQANFDSGSLPENSELSVSKETPENTESASISGNLSSSTEDTGLMFEDDLSPAVEIIPEITAPLPEDAAPVSDQISTPETPAE